MDSYYNWKTWNWIQWMPIRMKKITQRLFSNVFISIEIDVTVHYFTTVDTFTYFTSPIYITVDIGGSTLYIFMYSSQLYIVTVCSILFIDNSCINKWASYFFHTNRNRKYSDASHIVYISTATDCSIPIEFSYSSILLEDTLCIKS